MSRICERCGDYTATQMVSGEDLCVECANRQSKLNAAERRASSHGIDYAELALGVEERDAELASLRADLAEARADVQRFEQALDVSQRELAQARAERVDALNRLGAGQVEYDSLYASLLDCQTERDEAEQITAACAEEVAEAEDDLDRQRRTIRALVVAARAMDRTGGGELEGEYWYPTVRTVLYEMKQAKQSGQQAGE